MRKGLFIFLISLVFILVGCEDKQEPELYLNAHELINAYSNDELQASIDYDDKFIQISGVISSIGGSKDNPEIVFYGGLSCTFDSQASTIASLSENTLITVNGEVNANDGMFGWTVELVDCEYISSDAEVDLVVEVEDLEDLLIESNEFMIIEVTGELSSSMYSNEIGLRTESYYSLYFDISSDIDLDEYTNGDNVKITGVVIYSYDMFSYNNYDLVIFDIEVVD